MGTHQRVLPCIWFVVGLCLVSNAQGQSSTLFPTPITSEELEQYAAILSLTESQSKAIEAPFQKYQQSCSAINQNDIPQWETKRTTALRSGPETAFDVPLQRKYYRKCLAIRARLAALDNQFLQQLDAHLSEDQRPSMQHVRLLRERARFRLTILRIGQVRHETIIDLAQLLRSIELSADEHKALEPVLEGYGSAMVTAVRRYGSALIERMIVWGDEQEDQEKRTLECNKPGVGVLEVNRKWLEAIAGVLSPQAAAQLRDIYRKEAYHGIYPDLENAQRMFDAVLQMPRLSDEQKTAITDQRRAYIQLHTQLTDRIIALLHEMRKSPEFWLTGRSSLVAPPDGLEKVHSLMDRRKKLNGEAARTLAQYLGDAGIRSLRIAAHTEYGNKERVRIPSLKRSPRFMRIQLANDTVAGSPMGGSPVLTLFFVERYPPIKTQWVQQFADKLELTNSQRDIALTQHQQYAKDLMAQRNAIPEEISKGEEQLWAFGDDDSFEPPTLDEVEELHNEKLRIVESLLRIDNRFFDDLEGTGLSPEQTTKLASARRSRTRSLYLRRSGSRMWLQGRYIGGRSELYELDLLPLLDDIEPLAESEEEFSTIRDFYDVTSANLAQQRFEAAHDCKLLAEQLIIESFHDGDDYYEFSLMGENDRARRFNAACARLASAEEQYYELNRSTPKQLMELLTPDVARALEDLFREAAYPKILEDPQAMHEKLETALLTPDLSEDERKGLDILRDEYSRDYRAMIDRLVASQRHPRDVGYYRIDNGLVSRNWHSQYSQQSQEVEALQFERKELNASFRRRLNLILGPKDRSQR